MRNVRTIVASLTAFLIILSLWGFFSAIYPKKIISNVTPKHFKVAYEEVSFRTKDNVLIRGWFIPSTKPQAKTIILLHGYPADKGDILPSRIFLHADYNLLLFDFRSLGKSEGAYSTFGKNETQDIAAALNYLVSRNIHEVGIWGLSMGGAAALLAAPNAPAIKAMIIESAYARLDWMTDEYYRVPLLNYPLAQLTRFWGWLFLNIDIKEISPAKAAKDLKIPVLFIYSKVDKLVSFKHALLLKETLKHNSQAKFIFTDHLEHGQLMENYQEIVKAFFDKNL